MLHGSLFGHLVAVQPLVVQSLNIGVGDIDFAFDVGGSEMDVGRASVFRRPERALIILVISLHCRIVRFSDIRERVVRNRDIRSNPFFLAPTVKPVGQLIENRDVAGQAADDLGTGYFLPKPGNELLLAEPVHGQRLLEYAAIKLSLLIAESRLAVDAFNEGVFPDADTQRASFACVQRIND